MSEMGDKLKRTFGDQAANVGDKAKTVASDAGQKIETAWQNQRASGASYLENVAGLVHQAAEVFDQEAPQAARYIHQAADQIDGVAEAVRSKSMREVTSEVQGFARRQPAIFFGGAMLLGFAAVRLFRATPPSSGPDGPAAQ
jgi:hypothetical protein